MGTSQSKRDAKPKSPLIPPWADQDPVPSLPPSSPVMPPADGTLPQSPVPAPTSVPTQQPVPQQTSPLAPPRRYARFRTSLGKYAKSGKKDDARSALGHWARTSSGGAKIGTTRVARAIRVGGAAIGGFAQAGTGQPSQTVGGFNFQSLAGVSVHAAIDRILDAFCPPGILDEDIARIAIGEALSEAMSGIDVFDIAAIDDNAVRIATLTFVAELVFVSVMGDAGHALAAAPSPAVAVKREADIRSLVREIVDIAGTKVLAAAGNVLTADRMTGLVSRLVQETLSEIAQW